VKLFVLDFGKITVIPEGIIEAFVLDASCNFPELHLSS
jgi:hypothetical protein